MLTRLLQYLNKAQASILIYNIASDSVLEACASVRLIAPLVGEIPLWLKIKKKMTIEWDFLNEKSALEQDSFYLGENPTMREIERRGKCLQWGKSYNWRNLTAGEILQRGKSYNEGNCTTREILPCNNCTLTLLKMLTKELSFLVFFSGIL